MTEPNGLPGIPALASAAYDELMRVEHLRAVAYLRQGAHEHEDEHEYAAPTDDAPVLSYVDYRAYLDQYEARLRALTPPAAMRLVDKRLQEGVT